MTTPITDAGGSTPSNEVVERVARAIHPELFCGDPVREHTAASPFYVEAAKGPARAQARAAIAAMPAPSVDPVGEVGEMIARCDRLAGGIGANPIWKPLATLLQQLADDNARKDRVLKTTIALLKAGRLAAALRALPAALTPEPFVGEPE